MRHQRTARGGRAGQLLSSSQQQQRPSPCQSALSTGRRPAQRRRKRDERTDARKWCEMRGDTTPVDERQSCTAIRMPSPRVLGWRGGEMAPAQSNHNPDLISSSSAPVVEIRSVHCLLSVCPLPTPTPSSPSPPLTTPPTLPTSPLTLPHPRSTPPPTPLHPHPHPTPPPPTNPLITTHRATATSTSQCRSCAAQLVVRRCVGVRPPLPCPPCRRRGLCRRSRRWRPH